MNYNQEIHKRKSIRLKDYDYSRAGAYFLTICSCSWNKECLFGDIADGEMRLNEFGQVLKNFWDSISGLLRGVATDEFVVMPNHMHGIVFVGCDVGAIHELPLRQESAFEYRNQRRKMLLPKIIGRFKMNSAKHINMIRNTPGSPVWQRNYYEHIIRNNDEMDRIREYIINNPVQWAEDENNPANIYRRGDPAGHP